MTQIKWNQYQINVSGSHEVLLHWNQYRTVYDVDAILYKSIHNRWLATYKYRGSTYAIALNEKKHQIY